MRRAAGWGGMYKRPPGASSLCGPLRSVIGSDCRHLPVYQKTGVRPVDFDFEWIAVGDISGMFCAAIPAGAGRKSGEQIDLGEKFNKVSGRTGLAFIKY
jgi:hypothetical protein